MSIPFDIPAQHLFGYLTGRIDRYGALLKDEATGRIVGHLQETGLLQRTLQAGLSFDPTGATSLIGIVRTR